MNWYGKVLKNYVGFEGRARRTEYWMFALINFIITFILSIIEMVAEIEPVLSGIYGLFILLPSLSVSVRRLHDSGRTGWWILIAFVPIIGFIVLLVFYCLDSEPGENKYGSNPKYS